MKSKACLSTGSCKVTYLAYSCVHHSPPRCTHQAVLLGWDGSLSSDRLMTQYMFSCSSCSCCGCPPLAWKRMGMSAGLVRTRSAILTPGCRASLPHRSVGDGVGRAGCFVLLPLVVPASSVDYCACQLRSALLKAHPAKALVILMSARSTGAPLSML